MQPRRRRALPLGTLLAIASIYGALISELGALHANILVDGTIGVVLGLFICSFPASAAIDLLYMDRLSFQRFAGDWADLTWAGLNLVVMAAGCMVTVVGATRFVGQ